YADPASFSMRNEWNKFAAYAASGAVTSAVPEGGRLDHISHRTSSHYLRGQVDVDRLWNAHQIVAAVGAEMSRLDQLRYVAESWYGYDPTTESHVPLDLTARYPFYYRKLSGLISGTSTSSRSWTADRGLSYFA